METLLHITTQAEWEKALRTGEYTHPSLESEGFIHCSKASQILWVANRFYRGNSNLILLQIDAKKDDTKDGGPLSKTRFEKEQSKSSDDRTDIAQRQKQTRLRIGKPKEIGKHRK